MSAVPLGGPLLAGMIHQDLTHELRGHSEKMRTVLPIREGLIDEPEIGFVYQRGWLQSMVDLFPPQIVVGEAAEFHVNKGRKSIECRVVAVAPIGEQLSDVMGGFGHTWRRVSSSIPFRSSGASAVASSLV